MCFGQLTVGGIVLQFCEEKQQKNNKHERPKNQKSNVSTLKNSISIECARVCLLEFPFYFFGYWPFQCV